MEMEMEMESMVLIWGVQMRRGAALLLSFLGWCGVVWCGTWVSASSKLPIYCCCGSTF